MDWRKLWVQKEGALIGALWGLISVFAALGMASSQLSLLWWHKLLILPVYLAGFIIKDGKWGWPVMLVPIIIGLLIGALVDALYKPKE